MRVLQCLVMWRATRTAVKSKLQPPQPQPGPGVCLAVFSFFTLNAYVPGTVLRNIQILSTSHNICMMWQPHLEGKEKLRHGS